MNDEDELSDVSDDFDPNGAIGGPALRVVLNDLAGSRRRMDSDIGLFLDFADGTAGRALHGPTISRDKEAAVEANRRRAQADRSGKTTWRHRLEEAFTEVVAEGNEKHLRRRLVTLGAETVAWIEAIDRRADEKRIERKQIARLPLFTRILAWWRRRRAF